jgi:hypothetical protein
MEMVVEIVFLTLSEMRKAWVLVIFKFDSPFRLTRLITDRYFCHFNILKYTCLRNLEKRAHDGCDQSAGDAYSSMASDPTSDIFRGPCTPIL